METLLKCPFCGGEASLNSGIALDGTSGWIVECNNYECIAYSSDSIYHSQDAAITRWNTRRPMERIVEKLEAQATRHCLVRAERNGYARAIEIVKEVGA